MSFSDCHPFANNSAKGEFLEAYKLQEGEWPVPFENVEIPTTYGKTHVKISGSENAPAMVLMHGFNATSLSWQYLVSDLSKNHRIFAIDNINDFGLSVNSKKIRGAPCYVNWLNEVLEKLQLSQVILLGMSYGSWVSAQFALAHPQKVSKLILLSPAATIHKVKLEFMFRGTLLIFPVKYFALSLCKWLFIGLNSTPDGQQTIREMSNRLYDAYRWHKFRPMVPPTVLNEQELASFVMPVLIVVGQNERVYDAKSAVARAAKNIKNVATKIVAGCAHDLPLAKPKEVAIEIERFLKNK